MTSAELDCCLGTEDSKSVVGESEAVGHRSGWRIVEIKRKKKKARTEDNRAVRRRSRSIPACAIRG